MLHPVPMYFYSWFRFRKLVQSEMETDYPAVVSPSASSGVATTATAGVATGVATADMGLDNSSSSSGMDLDMHMDMDLDLKSPRKSAVLRHPECDNDISSTQDESDISSTFWFRVVGDKNKKIAAPRNAVEAAAAEAEPDASVDFTVYSDTDRIMRVIPFVSLVLRMDYSESHNSSHGNEQDDNDDHNCITELLARQKDQELFYGDLRQRTEQVKGMNANIAVDEVLSLPEDLELDEDEVDDDTDSTPAFQVEEPNDTTEKEALGTNVTTSRITAEASHGDGETVGVVKEQNELNENEPLFGSGHEPLFVSGPSTTPVALPRAPIPKLISFDSSVSDGSCSASWDHILDHYQTMEETNTDTSCSNNNNNVTACSSNEEEEAREEIFILDPVDPLVYGSIDYPYLKKSSDKLYQLLKHHLLHLGDEDDDDDDNDHKVHNDTAARDLIQAYPETCQVRYHPPQFGGAVYPLSYFCATGHLLNIQAAYTAYPEAVGQEDPWVGTPLHYACYHNAGIQVVEYLVQKFPEAVRVTNYSHQTPVHMACMSDQISLPVVELLLEHYPTAAQLADQDGYTPFHLACLHGANTELLQLLIQTSPSVIRMNTRALQKALHVTCLHAPITETVELLIRRDPACVRATDEFFQTPLHCAVQGKACEQILTLLVQAHPGALYLTNDFDETPYKMAERLGAPADVLTLLKT
jgi:hypothetical protein